jgi:xanthine dehydrogenase accessory factor
LVDDRESGPPLVLVKGAGDFATGIIHRLSRAGFRVVATELEGPLAVRRWVALSEAVHEGEYTVEGVTAVLCDPDEVDRVLGEGRVPLLVDPEASVLRLRRFDIVIDARSAKRNLGTSIDEAPIVIAIGPGFTAAVDCHAVVETLAGRHVGRVILDGSAEPDTGVPYPLDGATPIGCSVEYLKSLVIRAPGDGVFRLVKDIGTQVKEGDVIGTVVAEGGGEMDIIASVGGLVRGIIRDGTVVKYRMKLGDIDPTMVMDHLCTISEKARAIGGGALEACMLLLDRGGNLWSRGA